MSVLQDLAETTATVAESVGDAVVGVGRTVRGAGVVIGDGLVLTNAHNLRGGEVTVTFPDGTTRTARVAGADLDGDLAVVAVDTGSAPTPDWADRDPGLGEVVLALARTEDGRLRVSTGQVSSTDRAFRGPRGRRLVGAFEHTAPLARGSSGGPVLDSEGHLLGLNTHRLGEGFYLAVPTGEKLRARVDALGEGKIPRRPTLGVAIAPHHVAAKLRRSVGLPERDGLLVRGVDPDGAGAAAGIEVGDLIVKAGEVDLGNVDDLHAVLDDLGDSPEIGLVVVRGVDERTVVVAV